MSESRRRLALGAFFAVCLITRGAWVLHVHRAEPSLAVEPDSASYASSARALAEHGRFTSSPADGAPPEFERTPGYPAFIAVVERLTGSTSPLPVLLAQVGLSALTVLLVYWLAARLFSSGTGLVAAAIVAVEPLGFVFAGKELTETLDAFLITAAALSGARLFLPSPRRPAAWGFVLGLAFAASALVRPLTYYLPFVVVVLLTCRLVRRRAAWRPIVASAAAFTVPLVVLVGGWQLRNHRQVGSWRLSGIEAKNLYLYRGGAVVAEEQGIGFGQAVARLERRLPRRPGETEGAYSARMYRRGLAIVVSNPLATAKATVKGAASTLAGVGRDTVFPYLRLRRPAAAVLVFAALSLVAFYTACLAGVFRALVSQDGQRRAHVFLLAACAYLVLVPAGLGSYSRFRAPIMPVLCAYAAAGVADLARRHRRIRRYLFPELGDPEPASSSA